MDSERYGNLDDANTYKVVCVFNNVPKEKLRELDTMIDEIPPSFSDNKEIWRKPQNSKLPTEQF